MKHFVSRRETLCSTAQNNSEHTRGTAHRPVLRRTRENCPCDIKCGTIKADFFPECSRPYCELTDLAVIACPGGATFAEEVITHLRHIYKHRFTLKNDVIAKRYDLDKAKLIQDINLTNDMQTSELCIRGNTDKYRPPLFKVDTRFTWFANGEFKAELLDCVRGKDVFIFQDVENHEPIAMNDGKNNVVHSVNDHVMTLLVTVDAVRQAGARQITLVVPAFPYARQHKKKSREGLTASLLCHVY